MEPTAVGVVSPQKKSYNLPRMILLAPPDYFLLFGSRAVLGGESFSFRTIDVAQANEDEIILERNESVMGDSRDRALDGKVKNRMRVVHFPHKGLGVKGEGVGAWKVRIFSSFFHPSARL